MSWIPPTRWFVDVGQFCLVIAALDWITGDVRTPGRLAALGCIALVLGVVRALCWRKS